MRDQLLEYTLSVTVTVATPRRFDQGRARYAFGNATIGHRVAGTFEASMCYSAEVYAAYDRYVVLFKRIATDKISKAMTKLADLQRKDVKPRDSIPAQNVRYYDAAGDFAAFVEAFPRWAPYSVP